MTEAYKLCIFEVLWIFFSKLQYVGKSQTRVTATIIWYKGTLSELMEHC